MTKGTHWIKLQNKPGRPKKIAAVDLARWTILIPWETRISVNKAAERQQTNLNTWIDNALLNASREVLVGKQEVAKPEEVMDVIKQMAEKLGKYADSLDKLSQEINRPKEINKSWWKKISNKS